MKQNISITCFLFILAFSISCKKDISVDTIPNGPDLVTKVNASISGFVTDENDLPVANANVLVGNKTAVTNQQGYFEVADAMVVKIAATVTINKTGYFKGIETISPQNNQSYVVRLKLIPKTSSGSFSAASGGSITLNNGLAISFPANAIVKETGGFYTGTTNVAAYWIDPLSPDLQNIMPGDLRGINTGGVVRNLITYGMSAVELTGSAGELLQIAPGKKAVLTMPLPSSMIATAPATIPLWHFDEVKGLWIEEGSATKTGNKYVGEVSHFSFWNCDIPSDFVQFNATIKDVSGIPLSAGKKVKISKVSDTTNNENFYTNQYGQVSGLVPNNQQLLLEIFPDYTCNTPVYSQVFTTTNVNVTMEVTVPHLARVTGSATTCNGAPVTNGVISVSSTSGYSKFPLNANGTFDFYLPVSQCGNNFIYLTAEDHSSLKQSAPYTHTIVPGVNSITTTLIACLPVEQFLVFTVNGITHTYTSPFTQFHTFLFNQELQIMYGNVGIIRINATGIGVNTSQHLIDFKDYEFLPDSTYSNPAIMVNITEYGTINQYIRGNFSGTLVNYTNPGTVLNISANFRVRRGY